MSGLRPYDGWWFYGEEERKAPTRTGDGTPRGDSRGMRSPPVPSAQPSSIAVTAQEEAHGDGPVISPFPIVAWSPFRSIDNDRLERALADASFRDVSADELVVHDSSGQRLSKVSFSHMAMSPLYWQPHTPFKMGSYASSEAPPPSAKVPTGVVPVRRAIWMQMSAEDDILGGTPLSPDADAAVEAVHAANRSWIDAEGPQTGTHVSGSSQEAVVERIVPLGAPLIGRVLVLRRGVPDGATMLSAAVLDDTRAGSATYVRKHAFRLVRGYMAYHIAVLSAWKAAEASEKPSAVHIDADSVSGGASAQPSEAESRIPPGVRAGGTRPETRIPPRASKNPALAALLLASPFAEVDTSEPEAPRALVLCVHGIGQKLAIKLGYNFVYDTAGFRDRIVSYAAERHARALGDVYVLPVVWRSGLKMTTMYFAEAGGGADDEGPVEANFEELVARITLDNIPAIRDMATDVGLDILLYMTPLYFRRILRAALRDIRRIYALFLRVGGRGAERTRVSLVGHSLGAAIVSDLLAFVPRSFPFEPSGASPHWSPQPAGPGGSTPANGADGQEKGASQAQSRADHSTSTVGEGVKKSPLSNPVEDKRDAARSQTSLHSANTAISTGSFQALADQAEAVAANLGFACDRFFAVGSPLAAFLLLKQLKPYACCIATPDGRVARTVASTSSLAHSSHHGLYAAHVDESDESDPRVASAPLAVRVPASPALMRSPGQSAAHDSESEAPPSSLADSDMHFPTMLQPVATEGDVLQPRRIVFACKELVNIFHPTDPIAYRMEPLIVSAEEMRRLQYPVRIPYTKGGALMLKRQVEESVSRLRNDIVSSLSRSLSALPGWMRPSSGKKDASLAEQSDEDATGTPLPGPRPVETHDHARRPAHTAPAAQPSAGVPRQAASGAAQSRLFRFNARGRVDYSLEEALFDNQYLSAISSHFTYWDDPDVAAFIAAEVCATISEADAL